MTANARTESTLLDRAAGGDRFLLYSAVAFAIGLTSHGIDHAIRGFDVVSTQVSWAGNFQVVTALITLALVIVGNRWGPVAAILIGAGSAIGFSAAHLLPTWSAFSDSYVTPAPGAGVTAYSWVTAVLEIGTAAVFAVAGARALRRRGAAA